MQGAVGVEAKREPLIHKVMKDLEEAVCILAETAATVESRLQTVTTQIPPPTMLQKEKAEVAPQRIYPALLDQIRSLTTRMHESLGQIRSVMDRVEI